MAAGSYYNLCCPLPGLKDALSAKEVGGEAAGTAAGIECVGSGHAGDDGDDGDHGAFGIQCVESGFSQ
jgi:hypothetical protein